MIRVVLVLFEILCFYQILRGMNGFKASENFVYILADKQQIRWVNIVILLGYVAGIIVLETIHPELARGLNHIGLITVPVVMVTFWRTNIKKSLFMFLIFAIIGSIPTLIIYQFFSLSAVANIVINLLIFSTLAEFKIIHRIYEFFLKQKIILYIGCVVAFALMATSYWASWYYPKQAILVIVVVAILTFIAIYVIKKRNEQQFIVTGAGQNYNDFKVWLEQQSALATSAKKMDIYELHSFWFSKKLVDSLTRLSKSSDFVFDIFEEKDLIKIHLLKNNK